MRNIIRAKLKTNALRLIHAGHSAREAARKLGLSNNTTSRWLKEEEGKVPRRRFRGKVSWDGVYISQHTERTLWNGQRIPKPYGLEKEARTELMDIAVVKVRDGGLAMLKEVEDELSVWPSIAEALDHEPRPAHKLAALENWLVQENSLCPEDLILWAQQGPLAWEFKLQRFPTQSDLETSDSNLIRKKFGAAAQRIREDLAKQESRHGPVQRARDLLIIKLGEIFDSYYEGEKCGYQAHPTEGERCHRRNCHCAQQHLKTQFIFNALHAASIPTAGYLPDQVARSRFVRLVQKFPSPRRSEKEDRPGP